MVHVRRSRRSVVMALGAGTLLAAPLLVGTDPAVQAGPPSSHAAVSWNVHHGTSRALRDLPAASTQGGITPEPQPRVVRAPSGATVAAQTTAGTAANTTAGASFNGIADDGVSYGAPSDDNIAVGRSSVVEVVNSAIAVWDKTGKAVMAPKALSYLWSGITGAGSSCGTRNDGDPVVAYDTAADRWVITQFSVPNGTTAGGPSFECVAVSTTADPGGAYATYAYQYNATINDYPKLGIWPDGYYLTFNLFTWDATAQKYTGVGQMSCAYERAAMLHDAAARQQCFPAQGGATDRFSVLPASQTGPTPPPSGTPNYQVWSDSSTQLGVSAFHVDWADPTQTTLSAPAYVTVPQADDACASATKGLCVPQPGTTATLPGIGDRVLFPLNYRNTGAYQSLLTTRAVTAGAGTGIQWYELRVQPGGGLGLYQSGIYAPSDSVHRIDGSMAMDQAGDIVMGFTASGPSTFPAIHYTGRTAKDQAGTMSEAEGTLAPGIASEVPVGNTTIRWGDYSSMVVDPSDDCTFWYVNQIYPTTNEFQWRTVISSVTFRTCAANDFSISAPAKGETRNRHYTTTVTTALTKGSADQVDLSVAGLPAGATATMSPSTVAAGGTATLSVDASGAATGTYPLTVVGSSPSTVHTTPLSLNVNDDYAVAMSPASGRLTAPSTVTVSTTALSTSVSSASPTLALSVSGLPTGASSAFSPSSVTPGGTSALTLDPGTATSGTYPLTVSATDTSVSPPEVRSTSYQLTIPSEFGVSASPTSAVVAAPGSVTTTFSTARSSGTANALTLSVSGVPAGMSATFDPPTVTAGQPATLHVTPGTAGGGTYPLTLTATDSSTGTAHSATFTVAVSDDFGASASTGSVTDNASSTPPVTLSTTRVSGTAHPLGVSVAGLPAGASAVFTANPVTAGSQTTMTLQPGPAQTGTYPLTVTLTDQVTGHQHSLPLQLVVDRVTPTAAVTGPVAPFQLGTSVTVTWSGSDSGTGIASYDVRWAKAPYNGVMSAYPAASPAGWSGLTTTAQAMTGLQPGWTYCFEVRATDAAGNISPWSAPRCTAVPLDDRALAASAGWTRAVGSPYLSRTVTRTTQPNRTLTRTGAQVDRVAVVATRCPTCGVVGVFVRGALVGRVNTAGPRAFHVVYVLPRFRFRSGPVVLKVLTNGKRVEVDGLGLTRA